MIRSLAFLAALALAGCGTTATSALTSAQIAAYAVGTAYADAAQLEITAAPHLSAAQLVTMKAADTTAYTLAKQLAAEAQAGAVVATDLTAGQAAVTALATIVKGN